MPATEKAPGSERPALGLRGRLRAIVPRSVRARILTWVVALTALAFTGTGAVFYVIESALIDQRIARSLAQEISEFEAFGANGLDPSTGMAFSSPRRLMEVALGRNVPDENQALLAFVGSTPTFVQGAGVDALVRSPKFAAVISAAPEGGIGTVRVEGRTIRYAIKAVQGADRDPSSSGSYVVASFLDAEIDELEETVRSYALTALVALMAVGLATWSVSSRLLQPLRDLRATADQISHSDLTRRIEVSGSDDISDLARTFNNMLTRLDVAFAGQRRFLDDAGHELRTPITIVRGHLELMAADDVEDVTSTRHLVLDELDRMSRLVDDLVVLARAQRPDFLRPLAVDLGSLTDDLVDKVRGLGDRRWMCDARAEADLVADPQRLTQAMLQLAANAARHTEPGGEIAIGSAVAPGRVSMWVRDSGPGVAPADLERIFERFERGPRPSKDGAGLGLSIVRAIAEAHGGEVRISSELGEGATFVIDIPSVAPIGARASDVRPEEVPGR